MEKRTEVCGFQSTQELLSALWRQQVLKACMGTQGGLTLSPRRPPDPTLPCPTCRTGIDSL